MNRYDALGEYISDDSARMAGPEEFCADVARIAIPENFPDRAFLEADQVEQEQKGERKASSSTCSILQQTPETT